MLCLGLVLPVAGLAGLPARAADLVMFDRLGCAWCARWDREIGAIYPRTPEGQRAPLRRVSLDNALPPDLQLASPVRYSPTFVLMENGREIGRITGYTGDYAFWALLTPMIDRLGARP